MVTFLAWMLVIGLLLQFAKLIFALLAPFFAVFFGWKLGKKANRWLDE